MHSFFWALDKIHNAFLMSHPSRFSIQNISKTINCFHWTFYFSYCPCCLFRVKPVCPEWNNNWHGICPVQNIIFQWFDKLLLMQSKILFVFLYNHIDHLCSFLTNYYPKIFFSFPSFLLFHLISSILYL